jgi:hypothetical protein
VQQPAVTTRDGTLITLNRYLQEPTPDVVLVGSSITYRLLEEYFSRTRLHNLALAGSSPETGLAIVAQQKQLPKIVLIETNVLSRPSIARWSSASWARNIPTCSSARCGWPSPPMRDGITPRPIRHACVRRRTIY